MLWAAVLALSVLGTSAEVVLTNIHSFTRTNDDGWEGSGLIIGTDGNLYGTTTYGKEVGSSFLLGTVFKMNTDGALTSLHQFSGTDGNFPGGLLQTRDGVLYGVTLSGGVGGGAGTVFKITTNGVLTTLHSFTGGIDGSYPEGSLVLGVDGMLYGASYNGGLAGNGAAFKISTNGQLVTLYSFGTITNVDGAFAMGAFPRAGLVLGNDGLFYGTTGGGGLFGNGTVFTISSNGLFTNLYSFSGQDGSAPSAALVQGSDGSLYGTTSAGGLYGYGTVFRITSNGALTSLYSFSGQDGSSPTGLVQGPDGAFYGTTEEGGLYVDPKGYGCGTTFRISTNGELTTLYFFSWANGSQPGSLVQGPDGSFYGTTEEGGAGGNGTVFRLSITQTVPLLQAMLLTDNTLNLTWTSEAGGAYQLQYNSDLNSTNWINLGAPLSATGATLTTIDSITNATRRLYRVVRSL